MKKIKIKSAIIAENGMGSDMIAPKIGELIASPPKTGELNAGKPPLVLDKTKKQTVIEELIKGLKSGKDPRQEAYMKMSEMLFDESKLKMIARLDATQQDIVMKNLIFIDFYQAYYSQVRMTIDISEVRDDSSVPCICQELKLKFDTNEKCPHCLGKNEYSQGVTGYVAKVDYGQHHDRIYTDLLKKYPEMVDNIMKLSISSKGLSRQEILNVLKATDMELNRIEGLKNWIGDKFQ